MKTDKLILGMTALLASAAFTACSSDEADFQQSAPRSNVINLTSSMAQTRAASILQTTTVSTSVKVGAFGISGTTAITNGNNNEYTVESNGSLSANEAMAWPSEANAKVSIYAYAPYQSGWSSYNSANAFSVATDQSSNAGYLASDLLYAKAENKTQTTDAIALGFTHKLSRINVTVSKSSEATVNLSNAAIYISNTKPGTTLNPSTGALGNASGTAADIKIATLPTDAGATVYGIVVPQQMTADTKFVKIVTADKTLVAKLSDAVTFESGKSYNYTATIGANTAVELTLGSVTLTGWGDAIDLGSATTEEEEYIWSPASFVAMLSSQSASYANGTYSWTAATNNLMTILEFPLTDGNTLANFKKLEVTTGNLSTDGKWRLGYVPEGGTYTNFADFPKAESGKTVIDLTALTGIDLSKVTKIQIGGATGNNSVTSGSLTIAPSDVVLRGYVETTGGSTDENTLTATFGTPGGNASYNETTYTWTGSTGNLMQMFSFSNGELANYTTLTFKLADLSGNVRVNFQYGTGSSDNLNISSDNNGSNAIFGSNGDKTITMEYVATALTTVSKTLADVTAIRFGGASNSGSCTIKASEVVLSK